MGRYLRWLEVITALLLCLAASEASAGKAATDASIPGGTRVRILDIGRSDSLYPERFKYIGKLGTTDKAGLFNNGAAGTSPLFNGTIILDNAKSIGGFGSQFSVEVLGSPPASVTGTRYVGSAVKRGSWVRILELGPTDSLFASRGQVVGKLCFVGDYDLYNASYAYGKPTDIFGGQVFCMDGSNHYFTSVSVELVKAKFKTKPATAASIPMYTRVKVTGLGPTDPNPGTVGKEGYVSSGTLYSVGTAPGGGTYYSGSVSTFDGAYLYFYQATFDLFTLDTPGSLAMGPGMIPIGTKVELQMIGALDGYYLSRKDLEGRTGVVGPTESLRLSKDGFYAGSITIDGKEKTFFQVSVLPSLGGLPTLPTGKSITPLEIGTRVRILDVSESDTYAKDRTLVVGREGAVINAPLAPSSAAPWYAGAIRTDDGAYYYFSQVAVLSLSTPAKGTSLPATPETPATVASIAAGTEVRIIEVAPGDSNYATRTALMGKTATVSGGTLYQTSYGTSSPTGGSYYGGTLIVNGATYYVNQVAVSIVTK